MAISLENWTKCGAEGQMPLITPPSMAPHVEEGFWMQGVGQQLEKLREKARVL
ncbi:hypothetical protein A2U01_0074010, partial [Trifolium medium]|nr:hypothetical protein [Trifolium medium]